MKTSLALNTAVAWLWLAAKAPQAMGQAKEPYVYAIYYGSEDCGDTPGIMRGYASDQTFDIQGHTSEARTDVADQDLCTLESLCLAHPTAQACTVNEFIKTGEATFSISEEGLVFECDNTNSDAECSFLDPECYSSSVFPNCRFQVVTTSTLVEDPSIIQHSNAANEAALDETSYIIYYSDENCNDVEGLEAIINNETNIIGTTNETISCRDAVACALHPEDNALGQVCQDILGVSPPPTVELKLMPISEDGQAVPCEGETCTPIAPDTCQKSTIHSSCYYRMPTSAAFFGTPEDFLPNYVLDGASDGGESDGDGDGSESDGDGTASEAPQEVEDDEQPDTEKEDAETEEPSAAAGSQFYAIAVSVVAITAWGGV